MVLGFVESAYTIAEGMNGTVGVRVTSNPANRDDVSISVMSEDGSATGERTHSNLITIYCVTGGEDYIPVNITNQVISSEFEFPVEIIADHVIDGVEMCSADGLIVSDEMFTLSLSASAGVVISQPTTTITITDTSKSAVDCMAQLIMVNMKALKC